MTVVKLGRLRLQLARVASSYEAKQLVADLATMRIPHAATVPSFNPPLQLDWGTLPNEQHLRDCVARMTAQPITHQERWRLQHGARYPVDAAVGAYPGDATRTHAAVFYPQGGTRIAFPWCSASLDVLPGDLLVWTWQQGLDARALPAAGPELITWVHSEPLLDPTEAPTREIPRPQ